MQDIDFVVTWVDGNDPAWRQAKAACKGEGDDCEARYRDWDFLSYWFRGVEQFAPWVRKIHFVTWGHVPAWLNKEHPKLHIVRHEDFIPAEYLPTFNSHTIELNMHRIPDLAEHFVYFNDDMFLTKETSPEYFFRKGLPCSTFGLQIIKFKKFGIGTILAANIGILNDHFYMRKVLKKNWRKVLSPRNGLKKVIKTGLLSLTTTYFPGLYDWHNAISFEKNTFEEVWRLEGDILAQTCSCHFREMNNVSPYLFEYWQQAKGRFTPRSDRTAKTFHVKDHNMQEAFVGIRSRRYHLVCINDTEELTDWENAAEKTREAFEEILPHKSSFEL